MKKLLIFTSIAEGATGLFLFAYPPIIVWLLFRAEVSGAGSIISRLAGLCLIALAVACWPEEGAVRPYYGMLTWSVLAAACLVLAGLQGNVGVLLWPMAAVHAALALLLVRTAGKD